MVRRIGERVLIRIFFSCLGSQLSRQYLLSSAPPLSPNTRNSHGFCAAPGEQIGLGSSRLLCKCENLLSGLTISQCGGEWRHLVVEMRMFPDFQQFIISTENPRKRLDGGRGRV